MRDELLKLPRSRQLAAKVLYAALRTLKEKGGQAPGREVMQEIERTAGLDAWALETYEKSGHIRWRSVLQFYTIGAIKAGYLQKNKGVWYLTPEGDKALELGEVGLLKAVDRGYEAWRDKNPPVGKPVAGEIADKDPQAQAATIDEMEQRAIEGLKEQIDSRNPYEFQDLVAALLRGMGYHTPFVAPKGKDGGMDVVAYKDPLGTVSPRIKVQVKHRTGPASVQEVRQLMGLLQKDGDVGMFVSTGGFTPDAKSTARSSPTHVELVDFERFVGLWQDFFQDLNDEDKSRLPLIPIWFYNPPA